MNKISPSKKAAASQDTVTLTDNGTATELPLLSGTVGPKVIDIRSLYAETGHFTYDPGYTSTGQLRIQDHLYRRRQGRAAASRLSDRGARRAQRLHGGLLPAAQRRAADRRAEEEVRARHHLPHDAARTDPVFLPRLPPRRAPDGGHVRRGRRAVGVLSRQHRHQRRAPAHGRVLSPDREDADDRGQRLQIFDRPAVPVSAERPELRRELPLHDVRGAVREVQGRSGRGARGGPHLHPACRPRAKRLDLDRAPRGLERRQSVRLHRRRHRLALGPGPWRRQRGRAQHAGRDRHARTASASTSSGPRTRTTRSA